jgi:hypothetical protein
MKEPHLFVILFSILRTQHSRNVREDLTDLERELAKRKEETKAMKTKAEPLAPPAATGSNWKSSGGSRLPHVASPPKPEPVKVSRPPGPPKQTKQFPPAVKNVKGSHVPDGIIAHLTRECGGNVHDCHVGVVPKGDSSGQSRVGRKECC